tara:strand:+ start:681 stop:1472 length:792 start_codon:yes stop_codon:yes gene_type:complete
MSTYESNYWHLVVDVLTKGDKTTDRTNTGTLEKLGMRFHVPGDDPSFPILTGRKLHYKGVLGELAAFLRGADTVKQFEEFGCNYWKAWADEDGKLGPIYGVNWLKNKQLATVIEKAKHSPNSRQLIVNAWDPATLKEMALPPCHFAFQLLIRGDRVHIVIYQRSLDIMVGLPSDVILYKVLQMLIAKELGLRPGDLTFMLGSAHIYSNHITAAKEYIVRPTRRPPVIWRLADHADTTNFVPDMFHMSGYDSEPPLSNALTLNV